MTDGGGDEDESPVGPGSEDPGNSDGENDGNDGNADNTDNTEKPQHPDHETTPGRTGAGVPASDDRTLTAEDEGERGSPPNGDGPQDGRVDERRAGRRDVERRPVEPPRGGTRTQERPREPDVDGTEDGPDPAQSPLRWALRSDDERVVFLRDVFSSVATVVFIALLLFAISGIWPPLVAVQSGSMEPHMHRGDLVFLMDEHRFPPDDAVAGTGVVTHRTGQETGYWSFGDYGNVVVYRPDGGGGTPIIHRTRFYVEAGDDWVARANDEYLGGVDTCAETATCPAPHDGFITKGDDNAEYDQVGGQSTVVKPSWIEGRAKVRVPFLGYVRLWLVSSGPPAQLGGPPLIGGVIAGVITRLELAVAALAGFQVARTAG